jgi:prepilin-type N-terminal cleavage/methylation domain-containing protein
MARGPVLNRQPRTRRQGGFTLIELLVTVVVTVVGLMGLFGVFTVTTRSNSEARESGEALSVLESAADELKSMTVAQFETKYTSIAFPNPPSFGPVPYHEPPGASPTGIHIGLTGTVYRREVEAKRIDDDLIWVRVSVRWAVEGAALGSVVNDRQLGLEMLRSRTEGPL